MPKIAETLNTEFSKFVKIWLSVDAENQRAKKKVGHSTSTQQGVDMKCPKSMKITYMKCAHLMID